MAGREEPTSWLFLGCEFHPGFQQIAMLEVRLAVRLEVRLAVRLEVRLEVLQGKKALRER